MLGFSCEASRCLSSHPPARSPEGQHSLGRSTLHGDGGRGKEGEVLPKLAESCSGCWCSARKSCAWVTGGREGESVCAGGLPTCWGGMVEVGGVLLILSCTWCARSHRCGVSWVGVPAGPGWLLGSPFPLCHPSWPLPRAQERLAEFLLLPLEMVQGEGRPEAGVCAHY